MSYRSDRPVPVGWHAPPVVRNPEPRGTKVQPEALRALTQAQRLVNEQNEDQALWEKTRDTKTCYYQQELRRLQEAVQQISRLVGIPAEPALAR